MVILHWWQFQIKNSIISLANKHENILVGRYSIEKLNKYYY